MSQLQLSNREDSENVEDFHYLLPQTKFNR